MEYHPQFRGTKKRKRKPHRAHERSLPQRFGGRLTPASGAMPGVGNKGDLQTAQFVVEAKCTEARSFRLSYDVLAKVEKEASQAGKWPLLALKFEFGDAHFFEKREWVVIPQEVWEYVAKRLGFVGASGRQDKGSGI